MAGTKHSKVLIIGSGPAGVTAAYELLRQGYHVTIFEKQDEPGGMMRYGIPGYRMPRDVMDGENKRILDMGVEVQMNTRVGRDISFEDLERDYDAILLAIGAQQGRTLNIPGGDAPNCVSGVAFLAAFNEGRMQYTAGKVVVIGGGNSALEEALARLDAMLAGLADGHGEYRSTEELVGGIIAVGMVLWQQSLSKHARQFWFILTEIFMLRNPGALAEIAAERKPSMLLLPYAIPIMIGSIIAVRFLTAYSTSES